MTKVSDREIAKKFLKELTPSEQYYFLNKVNEALFRDRYTPNEDLFYYCYFLTLKERFRNFRPLGAEGYIRYLYAEGLKDLEDLIRIYKERIELKRNSDRVENPKKIK